ncbi:RAMP superfamily CRISPR-associated protein [Halotia wernerae UHCC 0503]|nr:RAMP superfamily CRISPR-associated protein [Halotia wernerae UHCC 0503]
MAKQRKSQNLKEQLSALLPQENLPNNSEPEPVWDGMKNPLQALNHELFKKDSKNQELVKPVIEVAIKADKTCASLYKFLNDRTKTLADKTLTVQFPWLLRVGGVRGFRELLLPVLHPVYGIPYIPASSLKGVTLAWARDNNNESDIKRLLGYLDGKEASLGHVQFLDAFPTQPCLSLDIANPQWKWQGHEIKYGTEPHTLLSLNQPALVIGIVRTKLGCIEDVETVKSWLKQALNQKGLGSRVSTGYGRPSFQSYLPNQSRNYEFQLWTQGMYGADIQKAEFRPTALRGMLRYWFRAFALGIYDPSTSKKFEEDLFGTIETQAKEGSIRIGVRWEEIKKAEQKTDDLPTYVYRGKIFLESEIQKHLLLVKKILQISSYLGGIGRGARRPLHKFQDPDKHNRLRGCYWEILNFELSCNKDNWEQYLQSLYAAFQTVKSSSEQSLRASHPGYPKSRNQDVLDKNTKIYLVPCLNPNMIHPQKISNWRQKGDKLEVIGKGLHKLYSSDDFKGKRKVKNEERGNPHVGGELGTPSYVTIKSNFPNKENPYQVVTIFGADHEARNKFAQALEKDGAILISLASAYGQSQY